MFNNGFHKMMSYNYFIITIKECHFCDSQLWKTSLAIAVEKSTVSLLFPKLYFLFIGFIVVNVTDNAIYENKYYQKYDFHYFYIMVYRIVFNPCIYYCQATKSNHNRFFASDSSL